VTISVIAINLLWLLPLASQAVKNPDLAPAMLVVSYAPLAIIAVVLRAGVPESSTSPTATVTQ
jgi:hypothetical protein